MYVHTGVVCSRISKDQRSEFSLTISEDMLPVGEEREIGKRANIG